MKRKPHSTLVAMKPVVPELTKGDLTNMSFDPSKYSERLAENTVAVIDQDMETFHFSNNEFYNNAVWAERIGHIAECAGYDADYEMASLAGTTSPLPRHSSDASDVDHPKT